MIIARYIFRCDICQREVEGESIGQILWGIDPMRPHIPENWHILMEDMAFVQLICDDHKLFCDAHDIALYRKSKSVL